MIINIQRLKEENIFGMGFLWLCSDEIMVNGLGEGTAKAGSVQERAAQQALKCGTDSTLCSSLEPESTSA